MKKTFGQFKRQIRARSELTSHERSLVKAFNQGSEAGRSDQLRRSPYAPSDERFEAWLCGFDEEAKRYVIAPRGTLA